MNKEGKTIDTDVLVIGGGLSGVFAAIKAKEAGAKKVTIVEKGHVGKSGCSAFAAGVIKVWVPEEDDFNLLFDRGVKLWHYLVDQHRLKDHIEQGYERVKEMESFGVELEKTPDGKIKRHPARGAHPVIMFHGNQMMETMAKAAIKKGVEHIGKTMVTDLLTRDGRVVGALGFNILNGDFYIFRAKATVLATGGNLYKSLCPGHRSCTGEGYMAAFRAGAVISGDEDHLINAFPARWDIGPGMNMFVGCGGQFLNAKGEQFMVKYHPTLKDRAQHNTLIPAFAMEVKQGNGPIYMDMTHLPPDEVRTMKRVLPFPMRMFDRAGLLKGDNFVNTIEWTIWACRSVGGLFVNTEFETSLPGLYACGEAEASYSLTVGLDVAATSGAAAGSSAASYAAGVPAVDIDHEQVKEFRRDMFEPLERKGGIEPDQVLLALQEAIFPYSVIVFRTEKRLMNALDQVRDIIENQVPLLYAYDPHYLRMALEARAMALLAEMQLRSAIYRKESRLALREDYPYMDNVDWLKRVLIKRENGETRIYTEDVPIGEYPVKPERNRTLHPMWRIAEQLGIAKIDQEQMVWV